MDYYSEIETNANIPTWSPGENIEINLIGDDDNSEEFEIYLQFIHYYLWFADRMILASFEINSSTTNESENNAIFRVPDVPIPLPDDEDLTVEIYNQLFLFLIFVRDMQGNYDIEVIFFTIGSVTDFDPFVLFLFIIVVSVISLGVIIIVRKNTAPRPLDYAYIEQYRARMNQSSPRVSPVGLKYCIYCGHEIILGAKYCGYCGKNLIISNDKIEL
jgi:hypothetical protein